MERWLRERLPQVDWEDYEKLLGLATTPDLRRVMLIDLAKEYDVWEEMPPEVKA